MEYIKIEETHNSPMVILDPSEGYGLFQGKAFASDAYNFFFPIIEWFDNYANNPRSNSTFEFKLEYINSASGKSIAKIFSIIKNMIVNDNISVKWYYNSEDDEMKDMGEEFGEFLGIEIEIIKKN